ncbi:MAG: DUF1638 domain-containing protein [Actinomycetes bacterium]
MKTQGTRVAVLTCGALANDVAEVLERCALPMDVHGVSALHHLNPSNIVKDVDAKLAKLSQEYDRIVVLYGDCGTNGRLDDVLSRFPAVRPAGVSCYEWYVGEDYQMLQQEQLGTYFLTDWLVANWDLAVTRGLGLDRFPWLKETYFRHITHLLYLRQQADSALTDRAQRIADYLGVPMETRDTGTWPIERVLMEALGDRAPDSVPPSGGDPR